MHKIYSLVKSHPAVEKCTASFVVIVLVSELALQMPEENNHMEGLHPKESHGGNDHLEMRLRDYNLSCIQ